MSGEAIRGARGAAALGPAPTIVCRGLRKTYDSGVEAVRGIDLRIAEAECFGLLGPNGAGKTTTIEIIEGLLKPTGGEVEVLGRTWTRQARELRQLLGISLQETRLSEKLTVRETTALFASFYKYPRPVREVLAELELTEKSDSLVGELSGGQRQRLAVATALVGNPRILFLDEPTTGLDPQSRRQLWEIVGRFQKGGGTVLLTTHYMEEAERLCDRVAIVDKGHIRAEGSPAALIGELGGAHVIEFALQPGAGPGPETEVWRRLSGVQAVHEKDSQIELAVAEPHAVLPELLAAARTAGRQLAQLSIRQASLEDVFVRLTGRHLRDE